MSYFWQSEKFVEPINELESELSWWVKLTTVRPSCTYYFGPFSYQTEAIAAQTGYIKDLQEERASVISIEINQEQPKMLTISEEIC